MADADRRQLTNDPGVMMRAAQKAWQSVVWTALPGIITRFDAGKMTCEVQPTIQAKVLDYQGNTNWVKLPLLVDCPVVFPSAGGFSLTFPIKAGDEVLVVFASRCIDSWWQSGGIQVQAELRMHDLSDGFVIPGPRSQPRVLSPEVVTNQVQLRKDDGSSYFAINQAGDMFVVAPSNTVTVEANTIQAFASGSAAVTAPNIVLNGNVQINGTLNVTGDITAPDLKTSLLTAGINVHQHNKGSGPHTDGPNNP